MVRELVSLCYHRRAFKWMPHARRDLRIGFDFRLKFRVQVPTQKISFFEKKNQKKINFVIFWIRNWPKNLVQEIKRGPKTWSRN